MKTSAKKLYICIIHEIQEKWESHRYSAAESCMQLLKNYTLKIILHDEI